MKDDYIFLDPRTPLPGCLVIVAKKSRVPALRALEEAQQPTRYVVRAHISDHIPLVGGPEEVMASRPVRLVRVERNPLTLDLHHGGANAVFFDLCTDADGFLSHVDVEVEAKLPSNALAPARTALNNLLDTLIGSVWIPMAICRLELYLKDSEEPLLHQFILPFDEGMRLGGALGGMNSIPAFDPYESLIREAVSSASPFYRFLCAYRLYEGLNVLRRTTKEVRDKIGVSEKLPSDLEVNVEGLKSMGFEAAFLQGVRTVNDLHGRLTETRNGIAHFLLRGGDYVVNTSDGVQYAYYALGAAVLLHYAHASLVELRRYWAVHLEPKLRIGSVLPLPERRGDFIVRAD